MKKLLIACMMLVCVQGAFAQDNEDKWYPTTLGVGVGVGTTGIVIDASTTINRYFGIRFGVDIMPKFKYKTDIDLKTEDANKQVSQLTNEINDLNTELAKYGQPQIDLSQFPGGNLPNKLDVEGKLTNTTWHFLIDVYPFKSSSFHATVGAYFGPTEVVSVYNTEEGFLKPINAYNNAIIYALDQPTGNTVRTVVEKYGLNMIGAELGDYFITPNPADNGNVEASIEVNSFRPYLGVGFGRAVPKGRIGCQFDLGVQFWGTPKVYAPTYDKVAHKFQREELKESLVGGDAGGTIKTISKISVYPVLNFRLVGRIL